MDVAEKIQESKIVEKPVGYKELAVSIVSADDTIFDGTVYMVTTFNDDGEFDILPLHTNFITLIKDKIILHLTKKEKKEFQITNGVVKVAENRVNIILGPFVGADILPSDVANQNAEKKKRSLVDTILKPIVS